MTFREKCNILHKEMVDALAKYHKAEAALGGPCSAVQKEIRQETRNTTYRTWLEAQMIYNEFLDLVVHLGKDLDDDMQK